LGANIILVMKLFKTTTICIGILLVLFTVACSKEKPKPTIKEVKLEGYIQGSSYHITYLDMKGRNFQKEIKAALEHFNKSLSVFDSTSVISLINKNDSAVQADTLFKRVFIVAEEVSKKTDGAFDMTVGPLVKLWGFNNGKRIEVTQHMVDSLKPVIGYEKVHLVGNKIVKDNPKIQLDANALAQGYSSDIIGKLLESKGIKNYMVEIGGEVITKGKSPRGDDWKIGINKPIDDSTSTISQIQDVVLLKNIAISTSGNYRKFYYYKGKKYSHEIDPHSGYPENNNVLSVSVIAPECITADAYATAFMVLGMVKSVRLLQKLPGVDAYFIYKDNKDGKNKVIYTRGFEKYLEKKGK